MGSKFDFQTVVWARVKGWPYWPGVVVPYASYYSFPKEKSVPTRDPSKMTVLFLGDGRLSMVHPDNVRLFVGNENLMVTEGRYVDRIEHAVDLAREYLLEVPQPPVSAATAQLEEKAKADDEEQANRQEGANPGADGNVAPRSKRGRPRRRNGRRVAGGHSGANTSANGNGSGPGNAPATPLRRSSRNSLTPRDAANDSAVATAGPATGASQQISSGSGSGLGVASGAVSKVPARRSSRGSVGNVQDRAPPRRSKRRSMDVDGVEQGGDEDDETVTVDGVNGAGANGAVVNGANSGPVGVVAGGNRGTNMTRRSRRNHPGSR